MTERRRPPDQMPSTESPAPPAAPVEKLPTPLLDVLDQDAVWRDTAQAATARARQKLSTLDESLARGKTQVRLDARRAGVRVPDHLAQAHALALNLSWRFADTAMVLNDRGVAATLTFGGRPFRCVLPWSSVWGIVVFGSDTVKVWPPDLPPELGGPPRPPSEALPPLVEPGRPCLTVVESPAEERSESLCEPEAQPPAESPAAKPRPPWLKLVR